MSNTTRKKIFYHIAVAYPEISIGRGLISIPLPSPFAFRLSFSFPAFLTLPFFPLSFSLPLPSFPLEVRLSKIQSGGLGERCKLPQQGLWQSLSQNQIWCILALKVEIW